MSLQISTEKETNSYLKNNGLPGEAVSAAQATSLLTDLTSRSKSAAALKSYIDKHEKTIRVMFFKNCPWIMNIAFDAEAMAVMCNVDVTAYNKEAKTKGTLEVPLDLVLYHELGHAKQFLEDPAAFKRMEHDADTSGALKRDGYYANIENDNLKRHEWPICDDIQFPRRGSYTDFCPMGDFIKKKRANLNWNLVKNAVAQKALK
ncbi:MAG: hypothetical protein A2V63_05570 [Candidatus Eisenbacteria bacterium RBG_19FT_COMBO_70_11]|nr:MAG: hypothetical protein A2V63_05570 [Candidatus Eisenbacteria bacterium RBG_19FT_COMBO_70_11]